MLEARLTQAEIARLLAVSRRTVCAWAKQLRNRPEGLKILRNHPRAGRPSRLSDEQWRHLLEFLLKGALEAEFETERWTLDRIQGVIRRLFGVSYHPHYVADRLKSLGWSPQLPSVVPKERDEELVLAWLAQDWPRIKALLQSVWVIIGSKCAIHPCFVGFSDLRGMQEVGTDFLRHPSGVRGSEKNSLWQLSPPEA